MRPPRGAIDQQGVDMEQGRSNADGDVLELLKFTYQREYLGHLLRSPVRLAIFDGHAWFIARDICDVTRESMMAVLYNNGANERCRIFVEPSSLACDGPELPVSSGYGIWMISEPRFYEVTSWRHASDGWDFKRWVMYEVLPTIRHLNPRSNRRIDLPVVQESVKVVDLAKTTGSHIAEHVPSPQNGLFGSDELPSKRRKQQRHYLYRFFDAKDRLLYVGESWNAAARAKQHRANQPWWVQVRNMTVEQYPSHESAVAAEADAIRTERPRYNRAGVVRRQTKKLA